MIVDGIKFRYAKNIVTLPAQDYLGEKYGFNYLRFGRVVPEGKNSLKAKQTMWRWPSNEPVWAVPIESDGWSLTNMMYGKDGKIYLMRDGKCYTAKGK